MLSSFSFLLGTALAALAPSVDPFYRPPAGYSTVPGTVLRYRAVNTTFANTTAYQLLYTSRSANGSALATVTTVITPQNATTGQFISFQVAEDSAWIDCAPSYNLQGGNTNAFGNGNDANIKVYLAAGYIVAIPDYEGPDAAFSAGRLAGYLVLDGMRAVAKYSGVNNIVGAGYSGGAIATGWAASLHPVYASDLNVKAWTSGGTPANLTNTIQYIDRGLFAGFQPASLVGLRAAYPQLQAVYQKYFTFYGNSQLDSNSKQCVANDILGFAGQSIFAYTFQTLGPAFIYQKDFAAVQAAQTLGVVKAETPKVPVLLYHATADEIISYAPAAKLSSSWCANGASVRFVTYTQGGHLSTESYGLVPAIQFASAAFAGTLSTGCSSETISNPTIDTNSFGPRAEDALLTVLNSALRLGATK